MTPSPIISVVDVIKMTPSHTLCPVHEWSSFQMYPFPTLCRKQDLELQTSYSNIDFTLVIVFSLDVLVS